MTKQRELIRRIVQTSEAHLSADEIYLLAKAEMPGIVMATVYNNLNAMVRDRQIRRVPMCSGADRYDRNLGPHGHLICCVCGTVTDFFAEELTTLLSEKVGEGMTSYDLNVRYRCPSCQKGTAES